MKDTGGTSGGSVATETQGGNPDAPGREPGTTACSGPSGKPLDPTHPQCQ